MFFRRMWGLYPLSVGFMLYITGPAKLTPEIEGQLILTVRCPKPGVPPANGPEFRLNARPVRQDQLPGALRAEFSLRAHRVLYLRGEGCLAVGDVVRAIDTARGAWYGLSIVLLTKEVHAISHKESPERSAGRAVLPSE